MTNGYLSVIIVPTTKCNCTCSHCFETLEGAEMSDHELSTYMRKIAAYADNRGIRHIVFNWQGGEVMCLSPAKLERMLHACKKIFEGCDFDYRHLLQSNLIAYSRDFEDLMHEHFSGMISSSLDYPNMYRCTPSISVADYERVWLEKKQLAEEGGLKVNIISVPNSNTLELGAERFYAYYAETVGARAVQINFPFPGKNAIEALALDTRELSAFVTELHASWKKGNRATVISPFALLHARVKSGRGRLPCIWSNNCAEQFFCLAPGGAVGQCDCWVCGYREFDFGNINHGDIDRCLSSRNRQRFRERSLVLLENTVCGECAHWSICHGGCPARAYAFTGNLHTPDPYCEVYKTLFDLLQLELGSRLYSLVKS